MPQDVWKCLLYFVVAWVCWTKHSVLIWQVEACLNQIPRLWTGNTFEPWEQLKGKRCSPELMATGLRLYSSVYLRCFVAVLGSGPVRRLQLRAGWSTWNVFSCKLSYTGLDHLKSFELAAISLTFYRFLPVLQLLQLLQNPEGVFVNLRGPAHSLPFSAGSRVPPCQSLKGLSSLHKKLRKSRSWHHQIPWQNLDSHGFFAEFARFCNIM